MAEKIFALLYCFLKTLPQRASRRSDSGPLILDTPYLIYVKQLLILPELNEKDV
jgi:hypothetical protein